MSGLAVLTYKYRLKDRGASKALSRHAYAVNQVFNWCAAAQRDAENRYRLGSPPRKWDSHYILASQCKGVGAELGIHQQTVQEVCRQFAASRDQHRRCPRFRASFGQKRALGWVPFQMQSRRVDGNSITYRGKKYRWFGNKRRPLPLTAKGGAFVEDALGRWYVTFHVEVAASHSAGAGIGIDLGLKDFAALSTGEKITAPRLYRDHEAKLATAQRARKTRRAKQIHAKIANRRRDFQHKLSTRLSREHAFIAVGNVNAKSLAKTKMAKSVLDAGWSAFRNMLAYKAGTFAEVDERFTTQACSCCGTISASSPKGMGALGIRAWDCSECGASHDRDVNAARNILALALSAQRPVEGSRRAAS